MFSKKNGTEDKAMADTTKETTQATKYGEPWDTATIAVTSDLERGGEKVRVDLNLPGDPKDRVIVETSIPRAARNMVDNIAGWLLKSAQDSQK